MDITAIAYPDAMFDVIYCSHVLEHVADDRQAMREFRRALRPEGWAGLLVPTNDGVPTREDPTITNPEERRRLFGQENHVRLYGYHYVDRLRAAGFTVRVFTPRDVCLSDAEMVRLGVSAPNAGKVHVCS